MESIVLGGGCFWCFEALYQRVKGVTSVTSGYAGGTKQNPTYWDLHKPGNDHAEVVKVSFNTEYVTLETILSIFWALHDPTTLNQQGADIGPEYRSIILYSSPEQKVTAENSLSQIGQPLWDKPIVTEIKQLGEFWPAEAEQQNYFDTHPEQAYCQIIINPKVTKLKQKFAHLLAN
ncbi:peptide-methionine (S)-S-oxide reductase MsrA [Candidatus Saccharibacteria bacterium]|nr:peptide-methionine (S)-S-oxide reductase MsrA [Candidatus Saccharibacteria bacterium]